MLGEGRGDAAEEAALSEAAARTADVANVGHIAVEAEQVCVGGREGRRCLEVSKRSR